jgi:hypothetical protein
MEFMGKVNYPRKTRLRRYAAKAGVEIAFLEKQELLLRDFGNAGRLVSRARRLGLDRLLAGVLAPFAQRYMVLARRALGPGDAGGSGDRCNARATQSNRARGHFWQEQSQNEPKGGPLAKLVGLQFVAEGRDRMRRSREPHWRKRTVLEPVENVAKGKTPDSISCE